MTTRDGSRGGVHRSPSYPSTGLRQAIEHLASIYKKEGRAETTQQVAAKAIGYKGISGPSGRALSALRQYGLLDYIGGGRVRVSRLGLALMSFPPGSEQHEVALREAATTPKLFSELLGEYPDNLPSEETLEALLVTERSFSASAARSAVKAFAESMAAAGIESGGGMPDAGVADEPSVSASIEQVPLRVLTVPATASASAARFRWPLGSGAVAELIVSGRVAQRHIDRLRAYLDIALDTLAEESGGTEDDGQPGADGE